MNILMATIFVSLFVFVGNIAYMMFNMETILPKSVVKTVKYIHWISTAGIFIPLFSAIGMAVSQ